MEPPEFAIVYAGPVAVVEALELLQNPRLDLRRRSSPAIVRQRADAARCDRRFAGERALNPFALVRAQG
jgi:hypothetical protein